MKIRNGFVSNSSSSSFLIYGIKNNNHVTPDDLLEPAKEKFIKTIEEYKDECEDIRYSEAMYDIISNTEITIIEKSSGADFIVKLEFHYPPYREISYIGRSYTNLDDSETGKAFKQHTKLLLERVFTKDFLDKQEIEIYEDSWYDG